MDARSDRWMLYLVLALAIVLTMACMAVSGAPEGGGAPAGDESSAEESEGAGEGAVAGGGSLDDPAGAVVDSAVKLKELKSYRSKTWQESRGEETAVVKEYLNPDRYRSISPDGTEIIIIGDTMYTKAGDDWMVDTQEGLADAYMKVYVTRYDPGRAAGGPGRRGRRPLLEDSLHGLADGRLILRGCSLGGRGGRPAA